MAQAQRKYTDEQIVSIPAGAPGRRHGGGDRPAARDLAGHVLPLEAEVRRPREGQVQRLKALEEENRRLKRMVADQALNIQVLQDAFGKEW